jgi:hypothetical protein
MPEDTYFKVRVHYENNLVTVSTFNQVTDQFEQCVSLATDKLNYPGIFLVSGGSGFKYHDHIYMKSFKLYDAQTVAENFHY